MSADEDLKAFHEWFLRLDDIRSLDVYDAALAAWKAREALAKPVEPPKCSTCNGHGEIGGLLPGDGGYQSDPCPDCAKPVEQTRGECEHPRAHGNPNNAYTFICDTCGKEIV